MCTLTLIEVPHSFLLKQSSPIRVVQMSLSSSNKKHGRNDEAVDLISNLPETILLRILCFVPTKSAAKTSVLSKRWENLWTKVPVLDFTEMPLLKNNAISWGPWGSGRLTVEQLFYFMKFVDKALHLNDSLYLHHFRLHISQDVFLGPEYHRLYVKSWLGSIRKRKCHEISITLDFDTDPNEFLPTKFLYNETLVILKLDGRFVLEVPFSFHLPNLKTIHLIHIRFSNDKFLRSISSGCPVLEELVIMNCLGISTLYVGSLRLRSLKLEGNMDPILSCIVIKTPNLRRLRLYDDAKEFDICDLNLLEEADLCLGYAKDLLQILRKCCTVSLCSAYYFARASTFFSTAPLDKPIQPFLNLTSLELRTHHCILSMFLNCAPKLISLTIEVRSMELNDQLDFKLMPGLLPHVECVVLRDFRGLKEEVELVKYFLKAGSILKKMSITYCPFVFLSKKNCSFVFEEKSNAYEGTSRKLLMLSEKLLKLPKLSPHCQIELIPEIWWSKY